MAARPGYSKELACVRACLIAHRDLPACTISISSLRSIVARNVDVTSARFEANAQVPWPNRKFFIRSHLRSFRCFAGIEKGLPVMEKGALRPFAPAVIFVLRTSNRSLARRSDSSREREQEKQKKANNIVGVFVQINRTTGESFTSYFSQMYNTYVYKMCKRVEAAGLVVTCYARPADLQKRWI